MKTEPLRLPEKGRTRTKRILFHEDITGKEDHKQAFSGGTEVTECDDLRTHNDGRYHLP